MAKTSGGAVLVGSLRTAFGSHYRPEAPTQQERDFVVAKRRLGASWGAVARMLGRSEQSTRQAYDLTYPAAQRLTVEAPSPEPTEPRSFQKPGSLQHLALQYFSRQTEAVCTAQVSDALGLGDPVRAMHLVYRLRERLMVRTHHVEARSTFSVITDAGCAELRRLGAP